MPPRRNVAPSNAVKQFFCDICSKGYPRQPDFENHLASYDHNHRQRLADMKRITARSEQERQDRKRGPDDSKAIDGPSKRPAGAPKFTRVGEPATAAAASGFTKVGRPVTTSKTDAASKPAEGGAQQANAAAQAGKEAESDRIAKLLEKQEQMKRGQERIQKQLNPKKEKQPVAEAAPAPVSTALTHDVDRRGTNEGVEEWRGAIVERGEKEKVGETVEGKVTWEQYDFTKPTGCDHDHCPGCRTDGIWDDSDVLPPRSRMQEDRALASVETA